MPGRTLSIFENYLDQDFAYFLGLIVARGETEEDGRNRRIMIDFPLAQADRRGGQTLRSPALRGGKGSDSPSLTWSRA